MRNYRFGGMLGTPGLGLVGALTLLGACGSSFGRDCQATRTCANEQAAGEAGAPAGGNGDSSGNPAEAGAGQVVGSMGGAMGGDASAEAGAGGGGAAALNPPPEVTSVTPKSNAAGVEPDASITITFSEPIDPATVSSATVKLLDGDSEVAGSITSTGSVVTFAPENPLALLGEYTVSVAASVTDLEGAPLAGAYESHFSVRDGQFGTKTAVSSRGFQLAERLPLNDRGEALLAWSDDGNGAYCPILVQRFLRGSALDSPTPLTAKGLTECDSVTVDANAAGVAGVAWQVPDSEHGTYVRQYRDGKWLAGDGKLSPSAFSSSFDVAVAPNGTITFFDSTYPGIKAYRADSTGKWGAQPDVLTTDTIPITRPEVVFDTAGNGLAVWRVRTSSNVEQILSSRFTVAAGKWAPATIVPGSTASAADSDYERGAPALAMDDEGNALALWINRKGPGSGEALTASRFTVAGGWGAPSEVAASLLARPTYDFPGLVFDGETFVAAFTATGGQKLGTYTTRFVPATNAWQPPQQRQSPDDAEPVLRMPRLVGDHRGNLILVWATGSSPSFKLVYQRYAAGVWSKTTPIPGGSVSNQYFDVSNYPLPLTMNDGGLAVLAWGNYDASGLAEVRLASFY